MAWRSGAPPDQAALDQALQSIVGSRTFAASSRLRRFLTFIVTAVLEDRPFDIRERTIALAVYDRGESFDGATDTIVRVEAGRLRHKLREYYETEGAADPFRIDLPKGSYIPRFRRLADNPEQTPAARPRRRAPLAAAAIILGATAALFGLVRYRPAHATDPRARVLCLIARALWTQRTIECLRRSIDLYQKALAIDPACADAWTGLALGQAVLVANRYPGAADLAPAAEKAARRALQLEPSAGAPHAVLATVYYSAYHRPAAAEVEFRRALQLSPDDATAHQWYGVFLMNHRRFGEAIDQLRRAEALDPISPMISTNLADAWYYSRQYDKALDQYRRTLDLHPHFLGAVIGTHAVWLARGEYRRVLDDANRWAAIYPEDPAVQTERAIAAARLGDKRILPHAQVAEFQRAYVYVARGDKDLAISALSKAFAAGEDLSMLAVDPLFDDLRGDPRFAALLARL